MFLDLDLLITSCRYTLDETNAAARRSPSAGRRRLTWRAHRRAAGVSAASNTLTIPRGICLARGDANNEHILGPESDPAGHRPRTHWPGQRRWRSADPQIGIQADVGRDQVERFQQYGVTSVPHAGAECVTLSVGGNTDHPVVINVDDRRYRMRGLKTGEMAIYDDQGMSVHLTRGGIVIRGAGKPMRLTDTSGIELDSEVHVTRGLRVDGNLNLLGSRATHNGSDIGHQHKHGGVQEGNGISGTPVA